MVKNNNGRMVNGQSSMNAYIKSVCDIMRRDRTKGAVGKSFTSSLKEPYRLHGIDYPHIGLKNTLSGRDTYMELFEGAQSKFDYIFTNPPFGGKEGEDARTNFVFKTGNTQILFIQHIINHLADGGT